MHSSHYSSFTIHHNGDYSGDYIICNIKRNELGEILNIGEDYIQVKLTEEEFLKIFYDSYLESPDMLIIGKDDASGETIHFRINIDEVLDFLISKKKDEMISEIESMNNDEFFTKYMDRNI